MRLSKAPRVIYPARRRGGAARGILRRGAARRAGRTAAAAPADPRRDRRRVQHGRRHRAAARDRRGGRGVRRGRHGRRRPRLGRPRPQRPRHGRPLRAARPGRDPGRDAEQGGRRRSAATSPGRRTLRDMLIQRARPFLFSTSASAGRRGGLPRGDPRPARTSPSCIERLWANTRRFKAELIRLGFDTGVSETPITPVMMGDSGDGRPLQRSPLRGGRLRPAGRLPDRRHRQGPDPDDRDRRPHRRAARPRARGLRRGRPRARPDRRVTADSRLGASRRTRPAPRRPPPHGPVARQPRSRSTSYAAIAVERGIAELAITDHVDFDPGDPAYRYTTFDDRERIVRDAAERWAPHGVAIRFGAELTYNRNREADVREHLRPTSLRLHDRLGPRLARLAVHAGRVSAAGSPAGRSTRSSSPYFTEVVAAARSGLFDTIGHLDVVKRYLHPARRARRSSPIDRTSTSRPCGRSSRPGRPSRSTRAGCARRSPRPTRPAPVVARFRELGGRSGDGRLGCPRPPLVRRRPRRGLPDRRGGRLRGPRLRARHGPSTSRAAGPVRG